MAFLFRLETRDGVPAEPPTLTSAFRTGAKGAGVSDARLARLLYGVRDGIKLSAGASPSTPKDWFPR
jgi:hypothetical protein